MHMQDQVRRDRAMIGFVWKRTLATCACIMLVFSTQKCVLNVFEHFDTLDFATYICFLDKKACALILSVGHFLQRTEIVVYKIFVN